MTDKEIKKYAKDVVSRMLNGRCQPELDDVYEVPKLHKERAIAEIYKVLDRLQRLL